MKSKVSSLFHNFFSRVCVCRFCEAHKKAHSGEKEDRKAFDTPKERVYSMANIRENKKNGKTVSFRFTACLERDAQGRQVRRYTTWEIPDGLTPARARKAAERAADAWEDEVKAEYQKEKEAKAQGRAYMLPLEKRHDDFFGFILNTWLLLYYLREKS